MYGIPDRLKALSAAEEQVLLALWDCKPPVSRRDIGARLAEKGWAAATVLTFLYRLEEKGWVTCTKEQNHNLYAPIVTRRAYGVYTMRQRLDTVFGGDLAQAVRALVSESGCSQSELEQAIAVLNEKHAEAEEYDLYDPYGYTSQSRCARRLPCQGSPWQAAQLVLDENALPSVRQWTLRSGFRRI